jgi:metal-responsive CopG/Arc/MetJ family transcriptional regulator
MTTEKPILNFVADEVLIKRIDNYRFENRVNSRSEAIRQLIEAGLEAAAKKTKAKTK